MAERTAENYEKPVTRVGGLLDIRTSHLPKTSSKASPLKPTSSLSYLSPNAEIATNLISIRLLLTNTVSNHLLVRDETKTCFILSVELHSTLDNAFYCTFYWRVMGNYALHSTLDNAFYCTFYCWVIRNYAISC